MVMMMMMMMMMMMVIMMKRWRKTERKEVKKFDKVTHWESHKHN